MKKVTSAALLALKLTWKAMLLSFLLTGAVQIIEACQELMPGGVPLQVAFGFESFLRSAVQPAGMWWMMTLLILLVFCAARSKGSKSVYTTNRLGLSETQMTLIFGTVFTGYFLLYWAFQLAVCYGFFVWYSRFSLVGSNAWMLAAWRSEWLHTLLPLNEWWGYLRNLAVCGSFGFSAAIGSTLARHGKFPLMSLMPALLCLFLLSGQAGEFGKDMVLTVLLSCFAVGYYFSMKGGREDEDL